MIQYYKKYVICIEIKHIDILFNFLVSYYLYCSLKKKLLQ
jgi:hypothetical protein